MLKIAAQFKYSRLLMLKLEAKRRQSSYKLSSDKLKFPRGKEKVSKKSPNPKITLAALMLIRLLSSVKCKETIRIKTKQV